MSNEGLPYTKSLDMEPEIIALKKVAQGWGGDIIELTQEEYDLLSDADSELSEAPFVHYSLSIDLDQNLIYYVDPGESIWPHLIHEMGHLFGSREGGFGDGPDDDGEFDFFGWEYMLVAHIGADQKVWCDSNSDYSVSWGDDFGTLTPEDQETLLKERVERAVELGALKLVDGVYIPVCRRPKGALPAWLKPKAAKPKPKPSKPLTAQEERLRERLSKLTTVASREGAPAAVSERLKEVEAQCFKKQR